MPSISATRYTLFHLYRISSFCTADILSGADADFGLPERSYSHKNHGKDLKSVKNYPVDGGIFPAHGKHKITRFLHHLRTFP